MFELLENISKYSKISFGNSSVKTNSFINYTLQFRNYFIDFAFNFSIILYSQRCDTLNIETNKSTDAEQCNRSMNDGSDDNDEMTEFPVHGGQDKM